MNPQGCQVEAGDVGQHYYIWRHLQVDRINFVFQGVTQEHEVEIRSNLNTARQYAGVFGDITVYASSDINFILDRYSECFGWQLNNDETRARWQSGVLAEAAFGAIFINMAGGFATDLGLAAHEYYHTVQNALARQTILSGPNDRVPIVGPVWMLEGGANYFSARILADSHYYENEDAAMEAYATHACAISRPLNSMEMYGDGGFQDPPTLGALATQFLARNYGTTSVTAYWQAVGRGLPWQSAFEATFGHSISTFYTQFDEYRQLAFPPGC